MTPKNMFVIALIAIISTYLYVFGYEKTVEMIKEEYLFFLALIPISLATIYFKIKLKNHNIIDFNKNSTPSLKTTVVFF